MSSKNKIKKINYENLEEIKELTPKEIQNIIRNYEMETAGLKKTARIMSAALQEIIILRRQLSVASFDESLKIGIVANNIYNSLPEDLK